jgi:hypothetical protein
MTIALSQTRARQAFDEAKKLTDRSLRLMAASEARSFETMALFARSRDAISRSRELIAAAKIRELYK